MAGYTLGQGGSVVNDWQLNPLLGGGAGGSCNNVGVGGAAGGNLMLVAGESIEIASIVHACGGGGQDASAGGGAGGILSVEAPSVTVTGSLHVRGGGGGCTDDNGTDGWVGGSGCWNSSQADGGDGAPVGNDLDGEAGGVPTTIVGAGGGGGSGIIIINVGPAQGTPTITGTLIPNATTSAVHLGTITPE